jgi:glycine amidinotransferase
MKYSVYQHWDPLKVCMVGKSYSPEFYKFVTNDQARAVLERIARETEEDFQKLVDLLESFGVEVLRPTVYDDYTMYVGKSGKIAPPPMCPRDYSVMLGNNFYFNASDILARWDQLAGESWGPRPEKFEDIPQWIVDECADMFSIEDHNYKKLAYADNLAHIGKYSNLIIAKSQANAAVVTRIGKDLYFGTYNGQVPEEVLLEKYTNNYPGYRHHVVDTQGHSDSTFCPVVPGLIVSLEDISYENTFPGWEVIYLPNQSWAKVDPFLKLKEKNSGKWWVPGEELNDDFTDFVDQWLDHWVGFVEETVFDVNMLVIDKNNVVCNNYNKEVFDAFDRRGITPHIINFRHRYFWDGGLHCITSDLHREGVMEDYFPERN